MNRKDGDDPNHLEGIDHMLHAEDLKKLKHLLEQLNLLEIGKMKETLVRRKANEKTRRSQLNNEKGIEINIYEKGSWHVDNVESQNFYGEKWMEHPKEKKTTLPALPEALSTEEAMKLWEKVQKAGYVDENYQPLISRTMSALLADAMAERLGISEKWKVFEALWNRKNMYRDYYKALNLQQSLDFLDEIKRLLR